MNNVFSWCKLCGSQGELVFLKKLKDVPHEVTWAEIEL